MKLFDYVNEQEFNHAVNQEFITRTKHPEFDLWILNYSKMCQFAHYWNSATEACRGVIVDADNNIVALPFKKFYNYEEIEAVGRTNEIPNLPFKAYEKLDGSLGILYWGPDDKPYIATRGSFTSDQAIHASKILHTKYADKWSMLDKNKTYLFEIIYPEDLHVVSYPGVDDIFLLAVIDKNTCDEDDIKDWKHIFNTTKLYDGVTDYLKIRELFSGDNKEGFVIRFENGFRMKLKFAEYWKLHFLKTGFTEKAIFGYIASGDNEAIHEAMSMFDEEHTLYYQAIIDKINAEWASVSKTALAEFKNEFANRKDAAEYFKTCTYPSIMFKLYSNADINEMIWNEVSKNLYNKKWSLKAYLDNKEKEKFYTIEEE